MKDINKILALAHFKYKTKNTAKKCTLLQNYVSMKLLGVSLSHAFTSPTCSLREKSSLPIFASVVSPVKGCKFSNTTVS